MCSWRRARVEATVLSTLKRSHFWLFRGSCGLALWRRCQPGSGATRSEPVFPTKREGPARGRRRHAMAVEALVPPGTARVAIRIATRVATVYTNAPKRHRGAISTDLCTLLRPYGCSQQRNSPTAYTNAPIRRGEARSSHLCTLLRSQGHPQPKPTAQRCTQMPRNGTERPFWPICVHSCVRRPDGEAHVAGAVTQPPTHTNSRSFPFLAGLQQSLICLRG